MRAPAARVESSVPVATTLITPGRVQVMRTAYRAPAGAGSDACSRTYAVIWSSSATNSS